MDVAGLSGPIISALRPWLGLGGRSAPRLALPPGWPGPDLLADLRAAIGMSSSSSSSPGQDPRGDARIWQYYVPTFMYIESLIQRHKSARGSAPGGGGAAPPLVVGISAPQGCGKTTLTAAMQHLLSHAGRNCVCLSIDDFYLTGAELERVARAHPDNFILQSRGNAGTHDLELFRSTMDRLMTIGATSSPPATSTTPTISPAAATVGSGDDKLVGGGEEEDAAHAHVRVPRFDKSLRGGRGDRAPKEEWTVVTERPDVILLEGWMLGFEALPDQQQQLTEGEAEEAEVLRGCPELRLINSNLRAYSPMHAAVDAWLVLAVADAAVVHGWRLEAERAMRVRGKPGMTDEQVAAFVERYMPAYRAYLPALYAPCHYGSSNNNSCSSSGSGSGSSSGSSRRGGPEGAAAKGAPVLKVTVDSDRVPVAAELSAPEP